MLPPIHRQVETYSKDDLLAEMETAGVDRVLLHPPGAVPGGNELPWRQRRRTRISSQSSVMCRRTRKTKAVSCLRHGCSSRAIWDCAIFSSCPGRENWPTDGTMDWIYATLEEKGLPLGLLAFNFLPTVAEIAERYPGLRLLIDHLGTSPFEKDDAASRPCPNYWLWQNIPMWR